MVAGVPEKEQNEKGICARQETTLTILVLNQAIEQDTGHRDSSTREVRIVVHALSDFNASRGVNVAGEERENVVLDKGSSHVFK